MVPDVGTESMFCVAEVSFFRVRGKISGSSRGGNMEQESESRGGGGGLLLISHASGPCIFFKHGCISF